MSTKIYNGYQLPSRTDVLDLNRRLRQHLDPVRDRLDAALVAQRFTQDLDVRLFGLPDLNDKNASPVNAADLIRHHQGIPIEALLQSVWVQLMCEQSDLKAKGRTSSWEYDPNRFELSIGRDPETGKTLAIMYCEANELREAFEAFPGVSEYGYWNNTDHPDTMTAQQWEQRRNEWNRVVPDTPAGSMLTFTLRSEAHPERHPDDWPQGLLHDVMPSRAERADHIVSRLVDVRYGNYARTANMPPDHITTGMWDVLRHDKTILRNAVADVLPSIDADLLARPLIDTRRLLSDEQLATVTAALNTVWAEWKPRSNRTPSGSPR